MTPREALDVLRDALKAWRDAGASLADAPHPQGTYDYNAASERLSESLDEGIPALETLAGCVVVSVEDAKHVVGDCDCHVPLLDSSKWTDKIENHGRIGIRIRAAIAEAEEAMR